jgi:hypothetical protein
MHKHDPLGFEQRYPGKKAPVTRHALTAIGPFHEISADGHEKLSAQALQMGGVGLPIYGYRDKWSGNIMDLHVVPDSRTAGALGHVYLDFLEQIGGNNPPVIMISSH